MEIINEKPLKKGGNCAECGLGYPPLSGKRVLIEYEDNNTKTLVTEPFDLCFKCYKTVKDTGEF